MSKCFKQNTAEHFHFIFSDFGHNIVVNHSAKSDKWDHLTYKPPNVHTHTPWSHCQGINFQQKYKKEPAFISSLFILNIISVLLTVFGYLTKNTTGLYKKCAYYVHKLSYCCSCLWWSLFRVLHIYRDTSSQNIYIFLLFSNILNTIWIWFKYAVKLNCRRYYRYKNGGPVIRNISLVHTDE